MNQYNNGRYFTIATRSFFISLVGIGLIAPFTFLKSNISCCVNDVAKNEQGNVEHVAQKGHSLAEESPQKQVTQTPKKQTKRKIYEVPLHNVELPNFSDIKDVKEKKRQFFAFIQPAIEKHHEQILNTRAQLVEIKEQYIKAHTLSPSQKTLINELLVRYKIKTKYGVMSQLNRLLNKVDIVPVPLTLVQAANESAWGTSRFSRVGLNFFGIWCFKKGCGMVPSGRDLDADHEVEAFKSVDDAIRKYTHNINTNNAYRMFRKIRKELRDENLPLSSEALASGLIHYSERGDEYVKELIEMIRFNQKYFQYSS